MRHFIAKFVLLGLLARFCSSSRHLRRGLEESSGEGLRNGNSTNTGADSSYQHQEANIVTHEESHEYFPSYIRHFRVRVDPQTKQPVERGRLHLVGGHMTDSQNPPKKYSLEEFRRALQCAPHEPDLDGKRGAVSLYKMLPPSKEILKSVCAYLETRCSPWKNCLSHIEEFQNHPPDGLGGLVGPPFHVKLLRIMNGELHRDWPWGENRFNDPVATMIDPILYVLSRTSGFDGAVFFMGEELTFMNYNTPFPAFSASPQLKSAEMPWPWAHAVSKEKHMYTRAYDPTNLDLKNATIFPGGINVTSFMNHDFYHTYFSGSQKPWSERIAKGYFLGCLTTVRQVFFDQVNLRPDLLEAHWTGGTMVPPWNPTSNEDPLPFDVFDKRYTDGTDEIKPGFLKPLIKTRIKEGIEEKVGHYKYLIVLTGAGGFATADRFPDFIAHSGGVVLLQESEFSYHFSERLKPWVHYVPLAYNAADVVEKIEWLKAHDHLAQRIANNARNFGRSYLRLEDYYCYVANALETVASITGKTSATETFNSKKIKRTIIESN